jgi:hypothetical protein
MVVARHNFCVCLCISGLFFHKWVIKTYVMPLAISVHAPSEIYITGSKILGPQQDVFWHEEMNVTN